MPPAALTSESSSLSYCGQEVRRHDNDRFLASLFAPARVREGLFALYAFNQEIARTREVVSETLLGQMRLQWWRDAVAACFGEGNLPPHPVAQPLAAVIRDFKLSREPFETLIDAREMDLEEGPPPTLDNLAAYARDTAVPLLILGLEMLGVTDDASRRAAGHAGIAYALAGLLRATPMLARGGRIVIPAQLLERHGCRQKTILSGEAAPELAACVTDVALRASAELASARALRHDTARAATPLLLAATQAGMVLDRLEKVNFQPFSPEVLKPNPWRHVALLWAAATGRW